MCVNTSLLSTCRKTLGFNEGDVKCSGEGLGGEGEGESLRD